jgi:uncharacterized protein DUF6580
MIYLIVVLAVLTRFLFISHVPVFTPVFGALLFAGARLRKRDAIWFPVTVLAIFDWILTTRVFHMEMKWEHSLTILAFAAMAGIGGLLRHKVSVWRFTGGAAAGSTAYFLISNFGVWLGWGLYPLTWRGLAVCYVAALPYYRNSLISTVIVGVLLFGVYELISRKVSPSNCESGIAIPDVGGNPRATAV